MGNHEELLESFMRDASVLRRWCHLGGLQTLNSYGVTIRNDLNDETCEKARQALQSAMPTHHLNFLSSLKISLELKNHFFCHAGVRPGIPFDQQTQQDLLWIRDDFLTSECDFVKTVVHGHTPVSQAELLPNRINIDTAAFASGHLTCLVIEGGNYRLLTT